MKTVDAIKNILIEQVNGYRSLLILLQKERGYLLNLNSAGIETLSKEKDNLSLKLRLLEEERLRLLEQFSTENGVDGEMSLNRLYDITGDDAFKVIRLQFISLIQAISELNEFNRILIDRSLNFLRGATGVLDLTPLKGISGSGQLLSREV
jgi:hypothetical protein